jgi:aryl-alcohol dehydrogenase-like predicted oxidoreductase
MMMDSYLNSVLGRTGVPVGRLGVACSYGAPTEAFEEAFERGVNYFYWGSMRKEAMALREKGLVRFLAVSSHNRPLFPELAAEGLFDILHVRYNAAHRGAEEEVFPRLAPEKRPGVVTYTATRWGDLLKPNKMPAGERPLTGADCYRFVLSNPDVDVCMTGPRTLAEMREALRALELGPLSPEEMRRIRRIGDHVHTHHRRFFG